MTTRTRTRPAPAPAPSPAPRARTRPAVATPKAAAPAKGKGKPAKAKTTAPVDTSPTAGIDALMGEIVARDGENTVMGAKTGKLLPSLNFIETGVFTLDYSLLGGIPEGAVSTFLGLEGSGKTSLAMDCVASAQRKHPDKRAVWLDMEMTFDPEWATNKGVDMEKLYYLQPDGGERCADYVSAILKAGGVSILVVDSIPAMIPTKIAASAAEDSLPAAQARLISRMCSFIIDGTRKSKDTADGFSPAIILINRYGAKIGGHTPSFMGEPKEELGGKVVRYLATTKIEVKKKEEHVYKDETGADSIDYNVHAFKVPKSKIGNSSKAGEYILNRTNDHPFIQAGEIDDALTVLTYAARLGWLGGGGAKQTIDGVEGVTFAKRDDMVEFLYLNPPVYQWLKRRIIFERRQRDNGKTMPPDGYLLGFGGLACPAF